MLLLRGKSTVELDRVKWDQIQGGTLTLRDHASFSPPTTTTTQPPYKSPVAGGGALIHTCVDRQVNTEVVFCVCSYLDRPESCSHTFDDLQLELNDENPPQSKKKDGQ